MTVYYTGIHALIDPEQSDPLPDGGRLQDVSLVLSDATAGGRRQSRWRRRRCASWPSTFWSSPSAPTG